MPAFIRILDLRDLIFLGDPEDVRRADIHAHPTGVALLFYNNRWHFDFLLWADLKASLLLNLGFSFQVLFRIGELTLALYHLCVRFSLPRAGSPSLSLNVIERCENDTIIHYLISLPGEKSSQ